MIVAEHRWVYGASRRFRFCTTHNEFEEFIDGHWVNAKVTR